MSTPASASDFGVLLNMAFNAFKAELHRHLAKKGYDDLRPSFGYVFRMLDAEPLNLQQVAERLDITPQGALKIINEMVAKGYVERSADPEDGRVNRLMLTRRARKVLEAARRFHAQFEAELSGRVGAQQVAGMRAALEAIVAAHGEAGKTLLRPS